MRVFAFVSAISIALALAPGGTAEAAPRRAASLNLCTDELLLMLGSPGQIVSVTHLAQNPAETPLWRQARRYRRNDGSLVSVAGMRPDLVLTMGGGARDRVRIAARLGFPTLDLPFPQSLADIETSVVRVATALGRPQAAAPILGRMHALAASIPTRRIDTVWLGGGGRSVAADGLAAGWMHYAGLSQRRLQGDRISLEQLLIHPPALLLRSQYRAGQYSSEQRWLAHPLAARARASRSIATDGRLWTCMGPLMIAEIARLRREAER
jgi:iron complex transport system substrate-binding protein